MLNIIHSLIFIRDTLIFEQPDSMAVHWTEGARLHVGLLLGHNVRYVFGVGLAGAIAALIVVGVAWA